MLDSGLFPHETVSWFMEHRNRLFAVRGNHDELILSLRNKPLTKTNGVYENSHQFTVSLLSDEKLDFLESLPLARKVCKIVPAAIAVGANLLI